MPTFSETFSRLFKRHTQPVGDRDNAELVHELMLELEDEQPSPLLLNLATGFPSALLCVLAAGVLAGALAGRQVGQPLHTIGVAHAAPVVAVPAAPAGPLAPAVPSSVAPASAFTALATRQAGLEELELQALAQLPAPATQLPLGDGRPR